MKKSIYLYPITSYDLKPASNNYILRLKEILSARYEVVNGPTNLGLIDLLRKLPRARVLYFNWITDIADKRLGYGQIFLLFFILLFAKTSGRKIIWFVHNNISHYKKNWRAKKLVRRMMMHFSDKILSHSAELNLRTCRKVATFDHPLERFAPVTTSPRPEYDLLIWGRVTAYKGVLELVQAMAATRQLQAFTILIAGKFSSGALYRAVKEKAGSQVTLINAEIGEEDLPRFFEKARYVFFCYNGASVLSSAALSKTLSYGKTVFGPDRGSFRELARKGLLVTYKNLDELEKKLTDMKSANCFISQEVLSNYAARASWENFGAFLQKQLGSKEEDGENKEEDSSDLRWNGAEPVKSETYRTSFLDRVGCAGSSQPEAGHSVPFSQRN